MAGSDRFVRTFRSWALPDLVSYFQSSQCFRVLFRELHVELRKGKGLKSISPLYYFFEAAVRNTTLTRLY